MVRRSTIKAEAFRYPFITAVLVLRFFSGRKVHWGGTVITTVSAGGVIRRVGSRWGCLGSRWVGIIGAAREGSIGSDSVVELYA
jgi:hypothetical protein